MRSFPHPSVFLFVHCVSVRMSLSLSLSLSFSVCVYIYISLSLSLSLCLSVSLSLSLPYPSSFLPIHVYLSVFHSNQLEISLGVSPYLPPSEVVWLFLFLPASISEHLCARMYSIIHMGYMQRYDSESWFANRAAPYRSAKRPTPHQKCLGECSGRCRPETGSLRKCSC